MPAIVATGGASAVAVKGGVYARGNVANAYLNFGANL